MFTELEKIVYNSLIDIVETEYSACVEDLAEATGLVGSTIVGVIGSLVKKDMVFTDEETRAWSKYIDIFPCIDDCSFLIDNYAPTDIENFKI